MCTPLLHPIPNLGTHMRLLGWTADMLSEARHNVVSLLNAEEKSFITHNTKSKTQEVGEIHKKQFL